MKPYILLITLTLSLLSCTRPTEYTAALSQVESYIEARPDSALTVLQNITPSAKADKAKHALLLSMALDKLRTYYYQGRIY